MVIDLELRKYVNNLIKRVIISLFVLIVISFALKNNYYYETIYNIIYCDTIDFSYVYSKMHFLLGKTLSNHEQYVISDRLKYSDIKKHNNSFELITEENLVINNINPGVVTFIGELEDLGNTIIVSGDNNIDYWYSNIDNVSVNLYDHITDAILGSTAGNHLIMTFKKDDEYLDYEGLI